MESTNNNHLTTIQIDTDVRDSIRLLADQDFRSMGAEVRWLVDQELTQRKINKPTKTTEIK